MKDSLLRHGVLALSLAAILGAAPAATAAENERFAAATAQHLAELQIGGSEVRSIEYKLQRNMTDKAGPAILGARAWVRLEGCSGWLVIDMNRSAFVRQAYTRGDCRIEGVPAY
jgi:hypothetical protein